MKLGEMASDSITGFTGVGLSRCEHLNGTVEYKVQPTELKDGKIIDSQWIGEHRITVPAAGSCAGFRTNNN